jgi:hypothetical protein
LKATPPRGPTQPAPIALRPQEKACAWVVLNSAARAAMLRAAQAEIDALLRIIFEILQSSRELEFVVVVMVRRPLSVMRNKFRGRQRAREQRNEQMLPKALEYKYRFNMQVSARDISGARLPA